MRLHVQELTPGCGEWKAVLFDKFGQAMLSVSSVESADKAMDALEDEVRNVIRKSNNHGQDSEAWDKPIFSPVHDW